MLLDIYFTLLTLHPTEPLNEGKTNVLHFGETRYLSWLGV